LWRRTKASMKLLAGRIGSEAEPHPAPPTAMRNSTQKSRPGSRPRARPSRPLERLSLRPGTAAPPAPRRQLLKRRCLRHAPPHARTPLSGPKPCSAPHRALPAAALRPPRLPAIAQHLANPRALKRRDPPPHGPRPPRRPNKHQLRPVGRRPGVSPASAPTAPEPAGQQIDPTLPKRRTQRACGAALEPLDPSAGPPAMRPVRSFPCRPLPW